MSDSDSETEDLFAASAADQSNSLSQFYGLDSQEKDEKEDQQAAAEEEEEEELLFDDDDEDEENSSSGFRSSFEFPGDDLSSLLPPPPSAFSSSSASSSSFPSSFSSSSSSSSSSASSASSSQHYSSPFNFDSPSFHPPSYLNRLLHRFTLKELIEQDSRLVFSLKHLDSDMQMLVYENYNKFISATEIIKEMKEKVNKMDENIRNLEEGMKELSHSTKRIAKKLEPNQEKIDQYVCVSKLLNRLEFLFDLPRRLSSFYALGAFSQAVETYRVAANLLNQYGHIPSFSSLKTESEEIVGKIKEKLRNLVADPLQNTEKQMEFAALLIQLDEENPSLLLDRLMAAKKVRFMREMKKVRSIKETRKEEEKLREKEREKSPRKDQKRDEKREREREEETELFALLEVHFLGPFKIFLDSFSSTFLEKTDGPKKKKNTDLCSKYLKDLTNELMEEVLTLSREELIQKAELIEGNDNEEEEEEVEEGKDKGDSSQKKRRAERRNIAIQKFLWTLQSFYSATSSLFPLLEPISSAPDASSSSTTSSSFSLPLRVNELIENSLRCALSAIIRAGMAKVHSTFVEIHKKTLPFSSSSSISSSSSSSSFDALPRPSQTSALFFTIFSEILTNFRLLLSFNEPNFLHLSSFYFSSFLSSLSNFLCFNRSRPSGGSISEYSPSPFALNSPFSSLPSTLSSSPASPSSPSLPLSPAASPSSPSSPSVSSSSLPKATENPFFFLFVSQICLYLESKELPKCVKFYSSLFAPPSAAVSSPPSSSSSSSSSSFSSFSLSSAITQKFKEAAQVNIQQFVETLGQRISKEIENRWAKEVKAARKAAKKAEENEENLLSVSPLCSFCIQEVRNTDSQLRWIFKSKSASSSASSSLPSSSVAANPFSSSSSLPLSASLSSHSLLNRELDRLFSRKVSTFGAVKFSRQDPLFSLLKALLKALIEQIRLLPPLSQQQMAQFAYDLTCLFLLVQSLQLDQPSAASPSSAASSSSSHPSQVLFTLLEDTYSAAKERVSFSSSSGAFSDNFDPQALLGRAYSDEALQRLFENSQQQTEQ